MKNFNHFFILLGLIATLFILANPLLAVDKRWEDLKSKPGNTESSQSANTSDGGVLEAEALGSLKIHEDGRVKPMDTFARTKLLIFSGRSTFNGKPAIDWLARVMFDPEKSLDDRIFKINNNEILFALGIKPNDTRRYSYNEIVVGSAQLFKIADFALSKDDKAQSPADKEFIRIYSNFSDYSRLLNSFLFALPVSTFLLPDEEVRASLGLGNKTESGIKNGGEYFSYLDIMEVSELLQAKVKEVEKKEKGRWTAADSFLWELEKKYQSFLSQVEPSTIFFIPSSSHEGMRWFSLTQVLNVAGGKNVVYREIKSIQNMVNAFRAGKQAEFNKSLEEYKGFIDEKISDTAVFRHVKAELFYNKLDPFYCASIFYGLAFLLILVYIGVTRKWLLNISKLLLYLGLLLHFVGLLVRFIITERPPITNLFETFIFVSFAVVVMSFLLEWYNKRGVGIVVGAFSGLVLLLLANKFGAEGDTLEVLVAVLRSNFWLSTHVVAVNLGYGGIVISGVIGHIYLIYKYQSMKVAHQTEEERADKQSQLKNIARMTYATQGFGLIFTLIGTVLGGVWADQSWGRFWGWDPKENGSLLIVLWSAIIFHARMGGMIKDFGFNVGSIVGIVVVSMAWFGINLLGVGLHSYGFTSGIARGLFSYIAIQFIFIFVCLALIEYRKQKNLELTKS